MPIDLLLADVLLPPGPGRAGIGEVESAIAVDRGRIVEIGPTDRLRATYAGARTIACGRRRAIPGLIDSHLHAVRAGRTWHAEVRWDGIGSLAEAVDVLAERCVTAPPGSWLRVTGGWHPAQFVEARLPTRAELDGAAPEHPVYAQLLFEGAVPNTRAIRACPELAGPDFVAGLPALRLLDQAVGEPDEETAAASTEAFLRTLSAAGVTGASDMNGFGVMGAAYRPVLGLWRAGRLPVRLRLHLGPGGPGREVATYRGHAEHCFAGLGDGMLRMSGFGEIPSFGCTDLEGLETGRRPSAEGRRTLAEVSRIALEHGWPLHVHAILEATLGAVLDAWEEIAAGASLAPYRFAICHAEAIGPASIERAARLGIGVAVQNRLMLRGSDSARAWGAAVARQAPPLRDLLDAGIPLGGGTDGTVANSADPWRTLWWMVTGRSLDGSPARAERHRLTRAEALTVLTAGSAWFTAEEQDRGVLAPGRAADLAVLSDDFFTIAEKDIPGIRSLLTVVDGRVVHRDPTCGH
jgi:predicted amidohydrolase YtcJ